MEPANAAPRASTRIHAFTATLALLAMFLASHSRFVDAPNRAMLKNWWGFCALAALFAVSELMVVHLRVGRSAHTVSVVEATIVIALFHASPMIGLGAHLIGCGLVLAIHRRQRSTKLLFNLAMFAVENQAAYLLFHHFTEQLNNRATSSPVWWPAVYGSITAFTLLGIVLVFLVIRLAEGSVSKADLKTTTGISLVNSLVMASVGITASTLITTAPAVSLLMVLPIAGAYIAIQLSVRERRRIEDLEFLRASSQKLLGQDVAELALWSVLEAARAEFRVELIEYEYRDQIGSPWRRVSFRRGEDPVAVVIEQSRLAEFASGTAELVFPVAKDSPLSRELFSRDQHQIAVVVAVNVAAVTEGVLIIAQPSTDVVSFGPSDLRLAEMLAAQLCSATEKARLGQSVVELRRLESQLVLELQHDLMTGILNRSAFLRRLREALESANGPYSSSQTTLSEISEMPEMSEMSEMSDQMNELESLPSLGEPSEKPSASPINSPINRPFNGPFNGPFNSPIDSPFNRPSQRHCAVMFLDLDDFKAINDNFGHGAGDTFLKVIAERIGASIRNHDLAARLGGDEFAVLLNPVENREEATISANRILRAIRQPIELRDGEFVTPGASIGVAITMADDTAESAIERADAAMFKAKHRGKGQIEVSDPTMDVAVRELYELELELDGAAGRGELELVFQSVHRLTEAPAETSPITLRTVSQTESKTAPAPQRPSQEVVAYEGLVRWNHPRLGMLSPERFMPTGLRAEVQRELRRFVSTNAIEALTALRSSGFTGVLSINIEAGQALDDAVLDDVAMLQAAGLLSHDRLLIEIPETAFLRSPAAMLRRVEQLRDAGAGIVLDDLGLDRLAFGLMEKIRPVNVKLSRELVRELSIRTSARPYVRAIAELGREISFGVIAKGVEDAATATLAQSLGCQFGQGYYFAHPVTLHELTTPAVDLVATVV
jgi:diguanylate cyclase (GGDEF)-like protein